MTNRLLKMVALGIFLTGCNFPMMGSQEEIDAVFAKGEHCLQKPFNALLAEFTQLCAGRVCTTLQGEEAERAMWLEECMSIQIRRAEKARMQKEVKERLTRK